MMQDGLQIAGNRGGWGRNLPPAHTYIHLLSPLDRHTLMMIIMSV